MVAKAQELRRQGYLDRARAAYEALLLTEPGHADALHMLGLSPFKQRISSRRWGFCCGWWRWVRTTTPPTTTWALHARDQVIALQPDHVLALLNRGSVKQHTDTVSSYSLAIALKPEYAVAH